MFLTTATLPDNQLFQIFGILRLREQGSGKRVWKGPDTVAFAVDMVLATAEASPWDFTHKSLRWQDQTHRRKAADFHGLSAPGAFPLLNTELITRSAKSQLISLTAASAEFLTHLSSPGQ